MMTSREHKSGTDRLAEVMAREPAAIYVNIQGDEPMITPGHLERLLRPFHEDPATQVSTLKVAIDAETALDPNVVKVVTDLAGRALYFSRARIPFDRDGNGTGAIFQAPGVLCLQRRGAGEIPPPPAFAAGETGEA